MTPAALQNSAAPPIDVMPTPDVAPPSDLALTDLPGELLEHIARHLPAKDVFAMVDARPASFLPALAYQCDLASVQVQLSRVSGPQSFERTMHAIRRLRPIHQIEPLVSLGRKLFRGRPADQRLCHPGFKDAVAALPDKMRPHRLVDLSRLLGFESAHAACMAGEPVALVGETLSLDAEELSQLAGDVIRGPAGTALREGSTVEEIARRFGLGTAPDVLLALEMQVVDGPASAAVAAGEPVSQVAQRYGIRSTPSLACLERTASRSHQQPRPQVAD
ncbi:hypothetical protein CDL60_05340 [Roseateles noduli]|nr:hypothetical protein CDL60_05340 [Roseateles noduli]